MKTETIDVTKELKKAERRRKIQEAKRKAKEIWDNNKQYLIVIVPAAAGVTGKLVKVIGNRHNLRVEERDRKLRCWDASLGHYWKLRRPLDNDDWVYINRRKQAGESLGEIFKSMGVLK